MAESFVKALYDYHSDEVGDLGFKAGTIIRVVDCIDDNWINGELDGKIGLFPANFVEPILITDTSEKTVVAKETYISGEDGVLTFFRGDVVTFLGFVDDYWCKGTFAGEVGLFPAFTVDGLDDISTSKASKSHVSATPTSLQESLTSPATTSELQSVSSDQPCAESLFEFQGHSDFELSFPAGKVILLEQDVDDEWFEGSYNGKSGIFPKSFVKIITPLTDTSVGDSEISVPYAIAVYPFVGETSHELSFREGDVIYLHCWVSPEWIQGECNGITGIFPSSFVQIQVELPEDVQESEWEKRNGFDDVALRQDKNSSFKVGDQALAIYSFATNIQGDLPLEVGDLIRIEKVIDDEWVQGRKNSTQVGLCPAVFLQLQEDVLTSDAANQEHNSFDTSKYEASNEGPPNQSENTGSVIISENLDHLQKGDATSEFDNAVQNQHVYSTTNQTFTSDTQYLPQMSAKSHDNLNGRKSTLPSYKTITEHGSSMNGHKPVKAKATKLLPGPKPALTPKPLISPKPDFLKKSNKPGSPKKPVSWNKTTESHFFVNPSVDKSQNVISPTISGYPKEEVGPQINTVLEPDRSTPMETTSTNNWVKFEEQDMSSPKVGQSASKKTQKLSAPVSHRKSNGPVSPVSKTSERSYNFSYKNLLDKSLDDDELPSPLHPEAPARTTPVPPPRLDLLKAQKTKAVTDDALSNKLAQQAEEFDTSHQQRKSSPSLNELREASQKSKNQRPVPLRRTKPPVQPRPLSYHSDSDTGQNGFPILDELDEEITKLNNELQKETKVLTGVEVLVQMVNKGTSRREELESKKGITERKINELKRQLKKVEDRKKHLIKLLDGFSCQADIKLKTIQLQDTLKENVETRNTLQMLLSESEDKDTVEDLQDNILFCEKAIKNLKSELDSLLDILQQLESGVLEESPSEQKKDASLRKKVIDEILDTEKSFGHDLNLCVKHFMKQLIEWKVDGVDCDLLFGNMPEVADLSSRLLHKLELATSDVDINDQIIGTCFVDFSGEITTVYGKYCRNHDDAIASLEKFANNEEIQQYFRKCLESIREHSSCWDLSSFLIKPVQRILKYPLLLNELLKNTPDNHPDKTGLIKANDVMTTAANDVNEFKRRKDLVQKYQKVEESGLSTKFQKFTWHSVVKKSTRFNQRITQFTGLVSQTVDERFNVKERMFYQIEKTVKNFIKNATQYLEQFEEVQASQVQTAENIIDFHQENTTCKKVQEYFDAQKYIGEDLLNELKHVMDEEVLIPLNSLVHLFEGPRRLIQKRHDKCLDYDSWANKIDKIKDRDKWKQAKEELEFAKKNYEALNAQLLDELPVFNNKALVFLQTCMKNFANVHRNFFVKALEQFSPSVQLSVVHSESGEIVSDFLSQGKLVNHEVFQLTFTPKKTLSISKPVCLTVSPKTGHSQSSMEEKPFKTRSLERSNSDRKKKAPLAPDSGGIVRSHTVSTADRNLSRRKPEMKRTSTSPSVVYGQRGDSINSSCIVQYTFHAEAPTELSVNKGDVVTVVQFHDKVGNSEWWKVEHSGRVGYVPSSYLAPHTDTTVTKTGSPNGGLVGLQSTEYTAQYDFQAHGPSEVSLDTGDVVKVLQYHDQSGHREWWSVEVNGQHGYVPASYLARR